MPFELSNFKNKIYHDLRDFLIIRLEDSSVQKKIKKYSNCKENKTFILLNDIRTFNGISNNTLLYFKLSLITKGETVYTYEYDDLNYNKSLLIKFNKEKNKELEFLITYIMSDMKIRNINMTPLCRSKLHQNRNNFHFHFDKSNIIIYNNGVFYYSYLIYLIVFVLFILLIIVLDCV